MEQTQNLEQRPSRGELLVQRAEWEAEDVLGLVLVDPEGKDLPAWAPGAHLDLTLPSGTVRQYSLCGDPADRGAYRIGVLREPQGRGGSEEVHRTRLEGTRLTFDGPRNLFPLVAAERYLFVAGGIGITPILSMIRALGEPGRSADWSLVYGGRSLRSMAYVDEVAELSRGTAVLVPQDRLGLPDLDELLGDLPQGTSVYCCGPEGLLRAVEERCARLLPPGSLHVERFTAAAGGQVTDSGFEVELRGTGVTLRVPPDKSLLQVVREAVPSVLYSCEQGHCGTCETPVLEGEPLHRDEYLTDEERSAGDTMMICVGRSKSARLVLDL
ncbi:PDR/VanB family oxidoreductase [Streptomyces sp. NPDC003038]|uniref:PDR/VanB family oxidoreductase n=1 Tax=unclassified Streptomyces TaxID=2593676 RepID=UPI0033B8C4CB